MYTYIPEYLSFYKFISIMFSPPRTRRASATAHLPAEPQFWAENLPAGHGLYNFNFFTQIHSDGLQVCLASHTYCSDSYYLI